MNTYHKNKLTEWLIKYGAAWVPWAECRDCLGGYENRSGFIEEDYVGGIRFRINKKGLDFLKEEHDD